MNMCLFCTRIYANEVIRVASPIFPDGPNALAATRSQVATTEHASVEAPKLVDAPVSIVTGASRGIGKAIALALGGAGGKVENNFPFLPFLLFCAELKKKLEY